MISDDELGVFGTSYDYGFTFYGLWLTGYGAWEKE
jgi:hypothetical protein